MPETRPPLPPFDLPRRHWFVARHPDPDVWVDSHVAKPLGSLPEPGDHGDVSWAASHDFKDHVAAASRDPAPVLQHEQSVTEEEAEPGPEDPDGSADQPAGGQ